MFDVHRTSAAAYSVTVAGDEFRYRDSNQAARDLSGLTLSHFVDLTPYDCFPLHIAEHIVARYRTCRDTKQALSYVFEANLKTGLRRWRTTLFPEIDTNGVVTGIFGVSSETQDELATDAAEPFHQKISLALDAMDGGFWVYELTTGVFEMSRSLAELIAGPGHGSLSLAEYIGYVHEDDLPTQSVLSGKLDHRTVEFRVITHDGRLRWLQSRRRVVHDDNGMPVRMMAQVTDITEQKAAVESLVTKASTDSLTSLANRHAFDSFGALAWARSQATGQALHLILFDLDGFKPVNDRYGHRAGDQILRKVARRVARLAAKGDLVSRIGGDEFAIVLQTASETDAHRLIAKLQRAFAKPFDLDGLPIGIGVSTGYASSVPADRSFAALVERADRALYIEKRQRQLISA